MWWTTEQATTHLGIKRRTLYTYASRGLVRRRSAGGRRSLYLAADVVELGRRAAEARGSAPAAGAAMRWGPPVLSSSLTAIDPDGPYYRGVSAASLVDSGASFEQAVAQLWGQPVDRRPPPPRPAPSGDLVDALIDAVRAATDPTPSALLWSVACAVHPDRARSAETLGEAVAASLGIAHEPTIDAVLVWCADHELNPSTFAARVAAGTGARLDRCLLAALAAWSGPRHGLASEALEDALLAGHAQLPGFGHPLYPQGDPRGEALVELAGGLPADWPAQGESPNLDAGLVALRRARGWPRGVAATLFAVGRTAGWIAHALEQAEQGPIRPRARYTGTEPWR